MTSMTESPGRRADEQRVRRPRRRAPPASTRRSRPTPSTFLGAQYDLGLAWVHFPEGFGGLGLSPEAPEARSTSGSSPPAARSRTAATRSATACAPRRSSTHGSDEQKQRYLRPLFTGEEIWCQLFSEPGAGSDVAGLSTRGVRDGDEWIVNGQKVWTTLAHVARCGLLVVRTDPDVPEAQGPHDVRRRHARARRRGAAAAPDDRRGRVQRGLLHRRAHPRRRAARRRRRGLARLAHDADERAGVDRRRRSRRGARARSPHGRAAVAGRCPTTARTRRRSDELMQLWIEAEVNRLTNIRAVADPQDGHAGPGGLGRQARDGRLNKRINEFCDRPDGRRGMLYGALRRWSGPRRAMDADTPQKAFLRIQANSIEGGTSEIMKNILGERVLGLPGDVRVDKDLPWSTSRS